MPEGLCAFPGATFSEARRNTTITPPKQRTTTGSESASHAISELSQIAWNANGDTSTRMLIGKERYSV